MTKAGTMKEIRKNWQNYALMAPFLILFALFTLIPIIYSVVISFTNFNINWSINWVWEVRNYCAVDRKKDFNAFFFSFCHHFFSIVEVVSFEK